LLNVNSKEPCSKQRSLFVWAWMAVDLVIDGMATQHDTHGERETHDSFVAIKVVVVIHLEHKLLRLELLRGQFHRRLLELEVPNLR